MNALEPVQLALDLPGVTAAAVGADINVGALDPDATLDACDQLRGVLGVTRWWLGDLAAALMAKEGPAEAYRRLAERGHDQADLAVAIAVAVDVHPDIRRAALSWSHHREVHRLDRSEQAVWLDRATAGGWSVRELRRQMKAAAEEAAPPLPGAGRLPRPPETLLRRALDAHPDGPVLWLPGDVGGLSAARVRHVQVDGETAHVVVEVDAGLAAVLEPERRVGGAA